MEFIDELANKVTSTVNKAAKKAEDVADLTKKKLLVKSEEDKLDTLYSKLGKLLYREKKRGENNDEAKEKLIAEIDSSVEKLKSLRVDIAKSKGARTCVACGAELDATDTFCPMCGEVQNY